MDRCTPARYEGRVLLDALHRSPVCGVEWLSRVTPGWSRAISLVRPIAVSGDAPIKVAGIDEGLALVPMVICVTNRKAKVIGVLVFRKLAALGDVDAKAL